ncbi:MAG TPA: MarC family protein [candidate division Zixibacteria bacterium]|nr:MarC family protein [candidate division Zixibacteria bacterium]HBZ01204.1 MarC family protein [candidate division Zixibacteria bacterium]
MQWHQYIEMVTAIIVIVDPLGAIPIFLGLTSNDTLRDRKRIARTASIAAGILMIASSVLGEVMLRLFGISVASFRVGGGILVLLTSISMMNARISAVKQTPEESKEAEGKENVAIVPLAVPLLAGPAAISTVIIFTHRFPGVQTKMLLIFSIVIASALVWISLRLSIPLSKKLGRTGLNNITRIMGLLLSAIAVEFITSGLLELFPGLQ